MSVITANTHPSTATSEGLRVSVSATLAAIYLGLVVLGAAALWWRHEEVLRDGSERAANTTHILAEHLIRTIDTVDATLRQLALLGQQSGGTAAAGTVWDPVLQTAYAGLSGVGSLTVLDANGIVVHSTVAQIIGQSRADRFVFQEAAKRPAAELIADTPFKSLTTDRMLIPLGRPLLAPDGTFDGLIVATLELDLLRGFYRSVNVGDHGIVWVVHPTGLVLFREPSVENPIGQVAPDFGGGQPGADGLVLGPSEPGGEAFVSALSTTDAPPLTVAVSLAKRDLLAPWWREAIVAIGFAVAIGLTLLVAGYWLTKVAKARDQAAEARDSAERRLAQAQRMEAIGQLTGGIAHDFNNLLTIIIGNAESVLGGLRDNPRLGLLADEILTTAERGADLTKRLLAFGRRQVLAPVPADVNGLLAGMEPLLCRTVSENIKVERLPGKELWTANVDPGQLENAVLNLVVNARDAMLHGGSIVIETANIELDDSYADTQPDVLSGDYIMISVTDTGTGMTAETAAHAFEPFFTTKEVGHGTGLGLSMVYGFVRQSGGHVKIYSELGVGTVVRLYLPKSGAVAARAAAPAPSPQKELPRGNETILVVEDDLPVRRQIEAQLTSLGYRIVSAADPEQAIARIDAGLAPDLLVSDVIMPKMNGVTLANQLRKQRPGMKVLYVSGYPQTSMAEPLGSAIPAASILGKPFRRRDLAQKVRTALDT